MSGNAKQRRDFSLWAEAVGVTLEEIERAWQDLQRRGLVTVNRGKVTVLPLALRRATSHIQRRLASYLAGYVLTENSFIVRSPGSPASDPYVLDSRIAVEHIANYFREGWGVTDIERDLSTLTREEIEAAIHYYLNHREEIDNAIQRSRQVYGLHTRQRELVAA